MKSKFPVLLSALLLALPALAATTPPAATPASASPATAQMPPKAGPVLTPPLGPARSNVPLQVFGASPDATCADFRSALAKAGALKEDKQMGGRVFQYRVATPPTPGAGVPAPLAKATTVRLICSPDDPMLPLQIEVVLSIPPDQLATVRAGLAEAYGGAPAGPSWTLPNQWRAAAWPRGKTNTVVLYQHPPKPGSKMGAASGQPGGKAVAMPLPSQIPVGATKATVATPAASAAPAKPAAPAGQPKP